tara:strand:- start:711 stop:1577 length:867 start_codon:yes stop_codon:yes gene_type:complete
MKILITGAFGQLGMALSQNLSIKHDVIRTGRTIRKNQIGHTLDIRDKILVQSLIDALNPDLIINLAAMSSVDGCELNPRLAREINIAGVQHLCDAFNGKIIHLSTDYVFDGKNGPYSEISTVSPLNVYGETKLASERILLHKNPNHLVLRGNVIYGNDNLTQASFLNWVVNSLKDGQVISVVDDQINNPTWTESMADIISLCIQQNISGIYHWGDGNLLSRYDFALKIAEKFDLDQKLIHPISTRELNQPAVRPLMSGLKSNKLIGLLKVVQPTIDDCLNKIRDKCTE